MDLPRPTYRWLLGVALVVLALDQSSKLWALASLTSAFEGAHPPARVLFGSPPPPGFDGLHYTPKAHVIFSGEVVRLRYTENQGAAFGLFRGVPERFRVPLFHLVAAGAAVLVFFYFRQLRGARDERFARWGLPLVLGGAAGNYLDRLLRGFVIDFVDLRLGERHWPAFNVADVAVVTGVLLLLVDSVVRRARD